MPTPSSDAISFSDIARIIYNNSTALTSLNDSDVRYLAGAGTTGIVSMSDARGKPTAGNTGTTYHTPGSYSWLVVPYENLTATVAGGGGSGGSYCGGQILPPPFFPLCGNYCCSPSGNPGSNTSFNGVIAYGGGGGASAGAVGAAGGNNLNGNLGGGGAGGAGNTNPADTNCNQGAGGNGGAGGYAQKTWRKAVDGPNYNTTINFTVGAGGPRPSNTSCRDQRGAAGSSGYVTISWS
jgi:hypothetical protein